MPDNDEPMKQMDDAANQAEAELVKKRFRMVGQGPDRVVVSILHESRTQTIRPRASCAEQKAYWNTMKLPYVRCRSLSTK